MTPCPECRLNKKKIFFNIDRAREQAKQHAIKSGETFALYGEGSVVSFIKYTTAIENGYNILEVVSKYE